MVDRPEKNRSVLINHLPMIGYLNGKILKKMKNGLILDTGGVGYLVHVTSPFLEKINEKDPLELFIHTKVREDDISLFGFETTGELDFFLLLLGVNGIGPKLALEILSQNPEKVKTAILTGDLPYLTKIPGIGKKTAERIVVELKSKITVAELDLSRTHSSLETEKAVSEDAINALAGLGYQRYEIMRVLKDMPENIKIVEDMVTYFLRNV
jgi:holliday junction DNA helicase RuvA